jgi:hypothetical protein
MNIISIFDCRSQVLEVAMIFFTTSTVVFAMTLLYFDAIWSELPAASLNKQQTKLLSYCTVSLGSSLNDTFRLSLSYLQVHFTLFCSRKPLHYLILPWPKVRTNKNSKTTFSNFEGFNRCPYTASCFAFWRSKQGVFCSKQLLFLNSCIALQ